MGNLRHIYINNIDHLWAAHLLHPKLYLLADFHCSLFCAQTCHKFKISINMCPNESPSIKFLVMAINSQLASINKSKLLFLSVCYRVYK